MSDETGKSETVERTAAALTEDLQQTLGELDRLKVKKQTWEEREAHHREREALREKREDKNAQLADWWEAEELTRWQVLREEEKVRREQYERVAGGEVVALERIATALEKLVAAAERE